MEIRDSRRLTGTNIQVRGPAAVVEVAFAPGEDPPGMVSAWHSALSEILNRFGLGDSEAFCRAYEGGASMGFTAPIDMLYGATEMNEWAVAEANAAQGQGQVPDRERRVAAVEAELADEANPRMRALQAAAEERSIPFLWDDDFVSVGYGAYSCTWPTAELPEVSSIEWEKLKAIPVALITGTNGKTTTSRLLTRILSRAGLAVGNTSTDGVSVNEELVERGDWTGTGAARTVLRRRDVSAAVLETARGGLLRRGLGVESCNVALITNVAEDHFGEYGINDVAAMARVKSLVCAVVQESGRCVINADDEELMALSDEHAQPLILTSLNPENPHVMAHRESGGEAWVLAQDSLRRCVGDSEVEVVSVHDVPFTFGGSALHNVSNALGAAAAAAALNVDMAHIIEGLRSFGAKVEDNPGRCRVHEVNGVRVVLDFGHNPHGVDAMLAMARRMISDTPEARLCVSFAQAGDRSDEDIKKLALTAHSYEPSYAIIRNVHGYERGRAANEVQELIRDILVNAGMSSESIALRDDELETLDAAFKWAQPGDLIVMLVHLQREQVDSWISDYRSALS